MSARRDEDCFLTWMWDRATFEQQKQIMLAVTTILEGGRVIVEDGATTRRGVSSHPQQRPPADPRGRNVLRFTPSPTP